MQAVDWVAGDCAKMHTSKAEASRRPAISVCKANLACGEAEDLGQNDTLQQLAEAAKQRGKRAVSASTVSTSHFAILCE